MCPPCWIRRARCRIAAEVFGLRFQLVRAQHTSIDEPALEGDHPPLVVAGQVLIGVEALQPRAREAILHRDHEPEHPALPLAMEDRLIRFRLHAPVAGHAAHVVYAADLDRSAPPLLHSCSAPTTKPSESGVVGGVQRATTRVAPTRLAQGLRDWIPAPRLRGDRLRGNDGLAATHCVLFSYTATARTSSDQSPQMSPLGPRASRSSDQPSGFLLKP